MTSDDGVITSLGPGSEALVAIRPSAVASIVSILSFWSLRPSSWNWGCVIQFANNFCWHLHQRFRSASGWPPPPPPSIPLCHPSMLSSCKRPLRSGWNLCLETGRTHLY